MPFQEDAVDRLKQTYAILVGDCQKAEDLLRQAETDQVDVPFHRRVFVRALAGFAEGMSHQMKCVVRDALAEVPAAKDVCGFAECEKTWLKKKRDGLSAIERFSIAVACYAKLHVETFDLKCVEKLNRLVVIRNRITHPKCAADLDVSDEDQKNAWSAAEAIIEDLGRLLSTCNAKVS